MSKYDNRTRGMRDQLWLGRDVAKQHYDTLQGWVKDTNKRHDKNRSDSIARMSAGGIAEGSEQWQLMLDNIEKKRSDKLKSFETSATQRILDDYAKEMREFYKSDKVISDTTKDGQSRHRLSREAMALEATGWGNPYDSGKDIDTMATNDFLAMEFGYDESYKPKPYSTEGVKQRAAANFRNPHTGRTPAEEVKHRKLAEKENMRGAR